MTKVWCGLKSNKAGFFCCLLPTILTSFFAPAWAGLEFPWQGPVNPVSELDVNHRTPRVAVDGQGNAQAVWEEHRYPDNFIQSYYRPAGGNWGLGVKVGQGDTTKSPSDPSLIVDGSGRALAVWVEIGPGYRWDLLLAARTGGGAWEYLTRINRDSGQSYKYMPALSVNSNGQVVAAWEDYAYGNRAIFYALSGSQIHLPIVLR